MRISHLLGTALLAALAGPSLACLPPPPGTPEPVPLTTAESAEGIYKWSTDIVYGVVLGNRGDRRRFRVLHVYKGALKQGQIIEPSFSLGFDPPPCPHMVVRPNFKGDYGVIAFHETPELNFVRDDRLKVMFDAGWIRSAQAPQ